MKAFLALALLSSFTINIHASEPTNQNAIKQLLDTLECPDCDLRNADFSGQNLQGANLTGANLSGADLTRTNLRGANLKNATLLGVKLSETALSGADLRNADLSDIDIDQVFEYIEIIGAQFEGARFKHGVVCGPPPKKGGWGCQQL